MERTIIRKLEEWKLSETRKPLILRGVRQVGKTWIMKEFGKQFFSKTAYINFDNNARMKDAFKDGFDIQKILFRFAQAFPIIDKTNG